MYPVWMAFGWALFGKSLAISHFMLFPFLCIIVYEIYYFSKYFLSAYLLKWAMLLLLLEPTFITQSILMAYDLILVCFFLMSVNALISGRKAVFAIATTFMVMSSVRGIMLLIALMVIHLLIVFLVREKPFKKHGVFLYVFPLLAWFGWGCWHYFQTGWFAISPAREGNHESFVAPAMMLRQSIYILWKLADFGRIALLLFVAIGFFLAIRKKRFTSVTRKAFIIIISIVIVSIIVMAPFANPIGHRYLLPLIIILPIFFLHLLQFVTRERIRTILIAFAVVALTTGNFWLYPERFGNGWDASLKVIPWFRMEKQITMYVKQSNIKPDEIGTEWPVSISPAIMYLNNEKSWNTDINDLKINTFNYILQTNIINSFHPSSISLLQTSWIKQKEWKYGQVYAVLYKKPNN